MVTIIIWTSCCEDQIGQSIISKILYTITHNDFRDINNAVHETTACYFQFRELLALFQELLLPHTYTKQHCVSKETCNDLPVIISFQYLGLKFYSLEWG